MTRRRLCQPLGDHIEMSVTISISSEPDDIWMIRNTVYRWFVDRARDFHPADPDIIERLTISGHFGGISLDKECGRSPDFGGRLVAVLLATADAIVENRVPLTDCNGDPWPELELHAHQSLRDLAAMLRRFERETPF